MFSFQTLILPILFVLVCLSIRKDRGNHALSMSNTVHLRGIFALCIMIFHISKEEDILYPVFYYLSQSVVSAFFFLSGYGLMKGYLNKEDYRKDYLLKRTVKLFLPYLFMVLIYWAYDAYTGTVYDVSFVLNSILGKNTLVMYSWFIKDIIIHYFLFYVLMLIFRDQKKYMSYVAFVMLGIDLLPTHLKIEPYLLNSMFCLGMIYVRHEHKIFTIITENRKLIFPASLIITLITRFFSTDKVYLFEKILFIIVLICILYDKKIENRFLKQAGKMSLEIYMTHGLAKMIVRRYLDMPLFIQDMAIYPVTFFMSFLLEQLFSFIGNRIINKA